MSAARRPLPAGLVALVALVLAAAGLALVHSAAADLGRRHVVVDGVPLDEIHPVDEIHPATASRTGRRPGVVVAHGFGGSARLMAQFGDALATRGYVVVLLDFSGHGANPHPLPVGNSSTDVSSVRLQRDLDVAVRHLRALPDVDPGRVALVGHSMGATAVTDYGATHADIAATVAISLPDSAGVPAELPHRLLLLVGALEFPDFHDAAEHAAGLGTDRSVQVIPHVEHISILFSPRTHRAVVDWLDTTFGGPQTPTPIPSPIRRLSGAVLLLLALLIGLYPLARLLFGASAARLPGHGRASLLRPLLVTGVAALVGALVAPAVSVLRLPLAIGGYLAGLAAVTGALMLLYQSRRTYAAASPAEAGPGRGRVALATPVLLAYAAVAIAVPLQLGVTNAVPVGARWWLLLVVWAAFGLFAYAAERVADGSALGALVAAGVLTAVLIGAAAAGLTSTFLVLILPLLAVLQLWQAVWSALLHRFAAPSWLIAAVGSLVIAWPLATSLPLVS